MKAKFIYFLVLLFIVIFFTPCFALDAWNFKRTYESKKLIDSPFFLNTAADVDKNGTKELVVADFGRFGDHIEEWKDWKKDLDIYNFLVLEWDKAELKPKWSKRWDMKKIRSDAERHSYFTAFEAMQLVAWPIGDRVIVETVPAYLALEYVNGKYVLQEQAVMGLPAKSQALPWQSDTCFGRRNWPMECLVGIRDFSGKGQPKIVTILEEKVGDMKYKQTIRVRKFEMGSPIEWEMESPQRLMWWTPSGIIYNDRLNWSLSNGLRLPVFRKNQGYSLEQAGAEKNYRLNLFQTNDSMEIDTYDLPDIHIGVTQKKGLEEYWGYNKIDISKTDQIDFMLLLRKVTIKPDFTSFVKEDINFQRHNSFLSVGFFDLKDFDGDGIDEVILVEETGKKKFDGHESVMYSDIKDYIHILKWSGKEYQTMWVSPPYTKRGTKFLIEDVKNTGKKQLVVLSPYGTVEIWEKQ